MSKLKALFSEPVLCSLWWVNELHCWEGSDVAPGKQAWAVFLTKLPQQEMDIQRRSCSKYFPSSLGTHLDVEWDIMGCIPTVQKGRRFWEIIGNKWDEELLLASLQPLHLPSPPLTFYLWRTKSTQEQGAQLATQHRLGTACAAAKWSLIDRHCFWSLQRVGFEAGDFVQSHI
jgi:hypothetical protein